MHQLATIASPVALRVSSLMKEPRHHSFISLSGWGKTPVVWGVIVGHSTAQRPFCAPVITTRFSTGASEYGPIENSPVAPSSQ